MKKIEKLAIEERRQYYKKWRASHKENVKANNARYWQCRAEKALMSEKEKQSEEN